MPGLYLVLDPQLRIVALSDAYARATKTRREEILGKCIFVIFPDNPDEPAATGVRNLEASLERVLLHRTSDAMAVQQYDIRKPDEEGGGFEERFWCPSNSPVFAADGSLAWIIHRVEDVTESVRRQAEEVEKRNLAESPRASEERLRLVLQASEMGTLEIDLVSEAAHWNTIQFELLGLEPGDAPAGPGTFFRLVHPDDVGQIRAQWDEAIQTGKLDAEFRIVRADGRERWLAGKGQFAFEGKAIGDAPEAGGRAMRFLGVSFDITDRKQAVAKIQESERRYRELIESLPVALFTTDADGYLTLYNEVAATLWGRHRLSGRIAGAALGSCTMRTEPRCRSSVARWRSRFAKTARYGTPSSPSSGKMGHESHASRIRSRFRTPREFLRAQ